jgi:16S rRNA (guanine966-N2)-methyltransferase
MRVIAGSRKGRRLIAPAGMDTRPTSDRVKENLFNILGNRVEGATVLDLYAGSGALAIEALSRGAERAVLVESDRRALKALRRNLKNTGFTEQSVIDSQRVRAALSALGAGGWSFDLIFLDPPYRIDQAELEAVLIQAASCLAERGTIVLEHCTGNGELKFDRAMVLVDNRRYGDTSLSFFEEREN